MIKVFLTLRCQCSGLLRLQNLLKAWRGILHGAGYVTFSFGHVTTLGTASRAVALASGRSGPGLSINRIVITVLALAWQASGNPGRECAAYNQGGEYGIVCHDRHQFWHVARNVVMEDLLAHHPDATSKVGVGLRSVKAQVVVSWLFLKQWPNVGSSISTFKSELRSGGVRLRENPLLQRAATLGPLCSV